MNDWYLTTTGVHHHQTATTVLLVSSSIVNYCNHCKCNYYTSYDLWLTDLLLYHFSRLRPANRVQELRDYKNHRQPQECIDKPIQV